MKEYIYDFIPPVRQSPRYANTFNSFSCRIEYSKKLIFPCVIGEWNKLSPEIGTSGSYNQKQPPRGVPKEKVFWKYAADLQESTHAEVRFH